MCTWNGSRPRCCWGHKSTSLVSRRSRIVHTIKESIRYKWECFWNRKEEETFGIGEWRWWWGQEFQEGSTQESEGKSEEIHWAGGNGQGESRNLLCFCFSLFLDHSGKIPFPPQGWSGTVQCHTVGKRGRFFNCIGKLYLQRVCVLSLLLINLLFFVWEVSGFDFRFQFSKKKPRSCKHSIEVLDNPDEFADAIAEAIATAPPASVGAVFSFFFSFFYWPTFDPPKLMRDICAF